MRRPEPWCHGSLGVLQQLLLARGLHRHPAVTPAELRNAEARYQRAFARLEAERVARNEAIRQAISNGWTHAQIADATGLTRARVGQIALRATA